MTDFALRTTVAAPYAEAVEQARAALAEEGFGVLTEIDMQATLKAKLGHDMEDYRILGACNPPLAHRAVEIDRQIGLLLPCNVVVRSVDSTTTIVEAIDPQTMRELTGNAAMQPIAERIGGLLQAALDSLGN